MILRLGYLRSMEKTGGNAMKKRKKKKKKDKKGCYYTLGLDIGIASIGWAVLGNNEDGKPNRIIDLGVRIFDKAEVENTGESLAAPRRDARSARRRLRRHRHRLERIRYLLVQQGVLTQEEMTHLYDKSDMVSPYQLRTEGLDRLLNAREFSKVLIHLAQRRGYQSNSTAEEAKNEKENGIIKSAILENQQRMEQGGYRTIGEMMYRDAAFWETINGIRYHCTRNKAGDYRFTVDRDSILSEVSILFEAQRRLGSPWASVEMEDAYTAILASQRSFDEGPGNDSHGNESPFRKAMSHNVGNCTLIPTELRAARADYTAEYFKLLQDLNHMRLVDNSGSHPLTQQQRAILEEMAFRSANLTYGQLRKKLGLSDEVRFAGLYYGEDTIEKAEKRKWAQMQSYHKIRTALDKVSKNAIQTLTQDQLDAIGEILAGGVSDAKRINSFCLAGIPEEYHKALLPLSISKRAKLSIAAMRKLIPFLQQGMRYDEACKAAGLDFHGADGKVEKLSDFLNEITNPVVRRAVSQTIKVVKAVVDTYSKREEMELDAVRIELAREMHHSIKERNRMKKRQEENREKNEQVKAQILETKPGTRVTGLDIVKFKLYQEQKGFCPYSGVEIKKERLYEPGYAEVDHIIPYSRCFDDSYSNKVLVLAEENQQKGNCTPYEYFGANEQRWHEFSARVRASVRDFKKRQKLLNSSFGEEQKNEFTQRNLNDTQHITRVVYNYLRNNLEFADSAYAKAPVRAVNGAVTAMLRGRWGIEKMRGNGDLHHCKDAVVIAATSDSMIKDLTKYYQEEEQRFMGKTHFVDPTTGEVLTRKEFPQPWPRFREELEARLDPTNPKEALMALNLSTYEFDPEEEIPPVFVSHMPKHTVTGAAHKETIRGKTETGTVVKTALTSLKLDKNGEIEGYYNPQTDPRLYQALVERLRQFDGEGKKAFAEPFYKPKKDGTPGPRVDKVKIAEKASLSVSTGRGVADNGEMIRMDVFRVPNERKPDDSYYFVPIYVADTKKATLPSKAVVGKKPPEAWKQMKPEHFLFSIFKGDLIYVESKKEISLALAKEAVGEKTTQVKSGLFYFCGANISNGSIEIETHDRRYYKKSLGIKELKVFEKRQVEVLGKVRKVKLPETRLEFRGRK